MLLISRIFINGSLISTNAIIRTIVSTQAFKYMHINYAKKINCNIAVTSLAPEKFYLLNKQKLLKSFRAEKNSVSIKYIMIKTFASTFLHFGLSCRIITNVLFKHIAFLKLGISTFGCTSIYNGSLAYLF